MEKQITDTTVARIVWNILQTSRTPLQWKINFASVRSLPEGTSFHVETKMKCTVKILYNEGTDLFDITITPDNPHQQPFIQNDVFCDTLVPVIDGIIKNVDISSNRVHTVSEHAQQYLVV